jgi:signal transduction histidine kinase
MEFSKMPGYWVSAAFSRKKLVSLVITLPRYKQFICQHLRLKTDKTSIASSEQGQITIETASHVGDGRLLVKVIDTGIGLTQKEIDSVFIAFSQGEFAESERYRFGGLGLGLTITRRLVVLQSGTIRAESRGRNQGATFVIEFPYLEPAVATAKS